jgi:DNA-binding CsgD family transcriptional regulator
MQVKMSSFLKTYRYEDYKDVADIFEPLKRQLKINYFGFCRLYKNNKFINLATDPTWSHNHYVKQKLPPAFLEQYETVQEGLILPTVEGDKEYGWPEGTVRVIRDQFHVENPIFIIKRFSHYIEVYGASFERNNVYQFYLNEYDKIEQLIFYFKDKASNIISRLHKEPTVHVFDTITGNIFNANKNNELFEINIKNYYIFYNGNNHRLSKKQYKVLSLTSKAFSTKQIALSLRISVRTVEYHIEQLKIIFSVYSKSALIEIFKKNHLR